MTELYIPPPGIPFRLLGLKSNMVLFSRLASKPEVYHHYRDTVYPDQYFTLIPGTGKYNGYYLIQGQVSNYYLFSRTKGEPKIGHWRRHDGVPYDDNYFKFEPGSGRTAGNFRLVNFESKTVLVSRTDGLAMEQQVINYPMDWKIYDDHYFSFLFTDMKIYKIDYKIDEAKFMRNTPAELITQTLENKTSADQTMKFTVNETTTDSSNFQATLGFAITAGAEGEAGVPFVAKGKVSLDVTVSGNITWGNTHTTSRSWTKEFSVLAPANKTIQATASVTRSEIDIPATIHSKSASTGCTVETQAIYHATRHWDLRYSLVEV